MIALDVATVLLLSGVFVLQALTTDYYLVSKFGRLARLVSQKRKEL